MLETVFDDKNEFFLFLGVLLIGFLSNAIINIRGIISNTLFFTGFDIFPHIYYVNEILSTGHIADILGYPRGLHLVIVGLAYTTGLPQDLLFNIIGLFFPVLFLSIFYLFIKSATKNPYFAIISTYVVSMLKSNGSALGFIWPFPSSLVLSIILLALYTLYLPRNIQKQREKVPDPVDY